MDSIPVVAITGQVGRALIGTDAFQEADISGITMPITKHNFLVRSGDDIPQAMAEAFHIASSGRPGPVLVDIPKDVLQGPCTFSWPPQIDLPYDERQRNVRGAFRCTRTLIGASVAVVDDVMTTGATLDEMARTLKRAGALHVANWVVARTALHD